MADLDETVRALVLDNKARIFPQAAECVEIVDIALGPAQHQREDRFHRPLTVAYRNGGASGAMQLWLKFRPGLDRLYPLLAAYHDRLGGAVFPAPYFTGHLPQGGVAFVATAFVGGEVLRNRLIRSCALRRTARLLPLLEANGAKMRRFHDASPDGGTRSVGEVVDQAAALTRLSPYFSQAEKEAVLTQLERSHALLPMTALPAVTTHNDWVLKNIIVTPTGADFVIDCDSMRHPPNWRWFDVVYLLLNIESQRKWFPLVTAGMTRDLWAAFWRGYAAAGLPDGLTARQVTALLYIVRIEWLVGGTVREPYFEIMQGKFSRRFLRAVKRGVLAGRYSLFDFLAV